MIPRNPPPSYAWMTKVGVFESVFATDLLYPKLHIQSVHQAIGTLPVFPELQCGMVSTLCIHHPIELVSARDLVETDLRDPLGIDIVRLEHSTILRGEMHVPIDTAAFDDVLYVSVSASHVSGYHGGHDKSDDSHD